MPLVDGEKVRADLLRAAQRRQRFLDQARKIEETVFKPLNLDPDALFKKIKHNHTPTAGYTDMASSKLATLVLDYCSAHDGKIQANDVKRVFKTNKVRCSPYVLLTRMVKANLLHRVGRGLYQRIAA